MGGRLGGLMTSSPPYDGGTGCLGTSCLSTDPYEWGRGLAPPLEAAGGDLAADPGAGEDRGQHQCATGEYLV